MKIIKLIRKNWVLLLIIFVGVIFRFYKPLTLFSYSHDQDLAGWFIRDVLVNHHLRLIGQETSSHGIFIGPYFYYLQIPFYLLTNLDPAGALLLPLILGIFTIFSIYFTFKKMFNMEIATIAALIYSFSIVIVFTDREIAPTMPVVLWTVWYLFALWCVLKGQKWGYIIIGILVGLIWSLNLQFIILLPLILVAQIFSKKRINFKELVIGILIVIILNIPFFAFEFRHGFQQINALVSSLTTNKDYVAGTSVGFFAKLDRVMQLVYKNSTDLFGLTVVNLDLRIMFWVFVLSAVYFFKKKLIDQKFLIILFIWVVVYILFFAKISLNISEYYLNGMNIIYVLVAAVGINVLIQKRKTMKIGKVLIAGFVILNIYSFFSRPVNANGYIQRKAIIEAIKKDADSHGFPCVSLSFITSPGNDLGYRYFTWETKLKTKPVLSGAPVYSIVFPLSRVDSFDKSFGALGLVLPDYKRYNQSTIQKACEGEDYTITQAMFGFTD